MDKFKFRGWDVIGKKWVYGDLVHNQKVTKTGLTPRVMVGGYEVDPQSVGIFVCKDINGTEIYTKDMVRTKYGRICFVEYRRLPDYIGPYLCPAEKLNKEPDKSDLYMPQNLVVVGNIYNNHYFKDK